MSQPGDCMWSLYSSSGVCVGMYGLTYSLYHSKGLLEWQNAANTPVYQGCQLALMLLYLVLFCV